MAHILAKQPVIALEKLQQAQALRHSQNCCPNHFRLSIRRRQAADLIETKTIAIWPTHLCEVWCIRTTHLLFCCAKVVADVLWQGPALPSEGFDPVQPQVTARSTKEVSLEFEGRL